MARLLMMRLASRVDENHKAVVKALRGIGDHVSVVSLASQGKGVPDLLVGIFDRTSQTGQTYLCEVKDGDKPISRRSLTPDQQRFIERWRGSPVVILLSAAHAVSWVETLTRKQEGLSQ